MFLLDVPPDKAKSICILLSSLSCLLLVFTLVCNRHNAMSDLWLASLSFFAQEAHCIYGDIFPSTLSDHLFFVLKQVGPSLVSDELALKSAISYLSN
ncbi:hypothetical protein L1887_28929 [Cichorium endivia]|nr:hypothetical protein L1887_28929 [Cichorium endivia]